VSKINEIRINLTDRLRYLRKKNYKYNLRLNPIVKTEYPESILDYKANIYNEKAKQFYKERGCSVREEAVEKTLNFRNKEVMVSKYCVKNQLALCPKQTPIKKYNEPFVLKDEFNKEYLVEFNCKDCVMRIRNKN
jgi:putative protease